MATVYQEYNDIEHQVKALNHPIVYKYRDWENDYHKQLLINGTVWFADLKSLNDPYDIRLPVRFDFSELDDPVFLKKLIEIKKAKYPWINPDSREFVTLYENRFDLIKEDPKKYFEENYIQLRESNLWDRIGVLSLSTTCVSEPIWAHYGVNGKGFCIGYDTIKLTKFFDRSFGMVHYNNEPPLHSFLNIADSTKDEFFQKHTKWRYEEEFRLFRLDIKNEERCFGISLDIIKEVVVGRSISKTFLDEIIDVLRQKYNSKVELYMAKESASAFGFIKTKLGY